MAKQLPRSDLTKSAGIVYYENTFTEGVLEGDKWCSKSTRVPAWDFSKQSKRPKTPSGYAEPGLYNVKDHLIRPRSGQQNLRFQNQCPRRPLSAPAAPDSRPMRSPSCPVLSSERRVPAYEFSRASRQPLNAEAPCQSEEAAERDRTVDLLDAELKLHRRPRTADSFKKGLTREQHQRAMRSFGTDICAQKLHVDTPSMPTTVELVSDIDDRPTLRKPVPVPVFELMPGREKEKENVPVTDAPLRRRCSGRSCKFGRGARTGEARCRPRMLSGTAGAIRELRATRTYDALPQHELEGC